MFDQAPCAKKTNLLFETTINIDIEVYSKLSQAAAKHHVSRSRLIAVLIEQFVVKEKIPHISRGTVQYQQSRNKEQWRKLHVVLPIHVHDYFDDVRKLWKMSLSYLVAMVVEKYLFLLDENIIKTLADKYWHGGHTIIHFIDNGLQYMLCCWGVPEHPPEIPLQQ